MLSLGKMFGTSKSKSNGTTRTCYDDKLTKSLYDAIKSNDTTQIEKLLAEADYLMIEFRNSYGGSLLHMAAETGKASMCEYFLKAGIKTEERDDGQGTALVRAACHSDEEETLAVVKTLLAAKAKANVNAEKRPILFFFMDYGHLKSAKLLIQHGADINRTEKRTGHRFTLLHSAAARHQDDHIIFLLENGANPSIQSKEKRSIFQFAMQTGSPITYSHVPKYEVLKKLLECGASPNTSANRGGDSIFHRILQHADLQTVKLFIRHGAKVGTLSKGKTARDASAKNKDTRVHRLIMQIQHGDKDAINKI